MFAACVLSLTSLVCPVANAAPVHHFIYFGLDRSGIAKEDFLSSAAEGAQLKYTWRELEPGKGTYDFSAIRADLAYLRARNKKLFLQILDVSFDPSIVNVPSYIRSEPEYHGGAALQYEYAEGHEDAARPYLFWFAQELFYRCDVLPFLNERSPVEDVGRASARQPG
jgi:hypothetical protein